MEESKAKKAGGLGQSAIYQIFLRNFTETGNFSSAAEYLPRLAESGIDIVYLSPIHPIGALARKGKYGSPYSIKDYTQIDPDLGTEKDFGLFVRQAREHGLKVMMDIVYNHCSPDSRIAREHPEWCFKDASGRFSRKVEEWSDVVDLDYSNEELRKVQTENLMFWRDKGVEGFRCDVAPLVPLDFWAEARKAVDPGRSMVWLAETVHTRFVKYLRDSGFRAHSDPEIHSVFDLSYDYDGFGYLESYFGGKLPLDYYLNHLLIQETLYPAGALKLRFLENHDLGRAASVLGRGNRLENWTSFFQLLPGTFLAYMGQELALTERPSLFEKDPIRRSSGEEGFESFFFNSLSAAKRIKAECDAFSVEKILEGVLRVRWTVKGKTFAQNPASRYTALLNLENRSGMMDLNEPIAGKEMLSGREANLSGRMEIPEKPMIIKED